MNNMKKILLAVTGMTPQVVTETLYALAVGAKWVPDEVHILTTKSGAESARLNLLTPKDGKPGKFFQLLVDYGLPPIAFSEGHIHVLQGSDGLPLDDIRSQSDNEAAADGIVNAVRELARDANTELHVSIAGGRKTMGYFLGYALSLFGRSPDRLSHVLVSPPYETNPDFFYPTPYSYPIQPKGKGMTVDAKNAKVDLAQIPFVRLADGLPKRLLEEPVSFTETVAAANRGMRLKIDVAQRKVFLQGEKLKLAPKEFWVLLWHAQKKKAGEAIHLDDTQAVLGDFFQSFPEELKRLGFIDEFECDDIVQMPDNAEEKHANEKGWNLAKWTSTHFEPPKSKIRKATKACLSEHLCEHYFGGKNEEFLKLPADSIEIDWTPPA